MRRYTWVVLTNCTPGGDEAFNAWYDGVHIADLLRIPGIASATRAELVDAQLSMAGGDLMMTDPAGIGAKYRYLACYRIETDDIRAVLAEIAKRAGTEEMPLAPEFAEAYTMMFADR
jgi:uncharacterized glyoxalase superfamily protein PhnB